jgi:hypothetical protein
MSRIILGAICGLVFGAIDIGIMLPMSFPDKKAVITAVHCAIWNRIRYRCRPFALAWLGDRLGIRAVT